MTRHLNVAWSPRQSACIVMVSFMVFVTASCSLLSTDPSQTNDPNNSFHLRQITETLCQGYVMPTSPPNPMTEADVCCNSAQNMNFCDTCVSLTISGVRGAIAPTESGCSINGTIITAAQAGDYGCMGDVTCYACRNANLGDSFRNFQNSTTCIPAWVAPPQDNCELSGQDFNDVCTQAPFEGSISCNHSAQTAHCCGPDQVLNATRNGCVPPGVTGGDTQSLLTTYCAEAGAPTTFCSTCRANTHATLSWVENTTSARCILSYRVDATYSMTAANYAAECAGDISCIFCHSPLAQQEHPNITCPDAVDTASPAPSAEETFCSASPTRTTFCNRCRGIPSARGSLRVNEQGTVDGNGVCTITYAPNTTYSISFSNVSGATCNGDPVCGFCAREATLATDNQYIDCGATSAPVAAADDDPVAGALTACTGRNRSTVVCRNSAIAGFATTPICQVNSVPKYCCAQGYYLSGGTCVADTILPACGSGLQCASSPLSQNPQITACRSSNPVNAPFYCCPLGQSLNDAHTDCVSNPQANNPAPTPDDQEDEVTPAPVQGGNGGDLCPNGMKGFGASCINGGTTPSNGGCDGDGPLLCDACPNGSWVCKTNGRLQEACDRLAAGQAQLCSW